MGNTLPVPTATVIITVLDENDNSPMFRQAEYSFDIQENMPAGTSVGTVVANDFDSGENAKVRHCSLCLTVYVYSLCRQFHSF